MSKENSAGEAFAYSGQVGGVLASVDLSTLSDEELTAVTAELKASFEAAKAERKRRNPTRSPDAVTANWRDKTGFEPLPAYDGFLHALDWQRRQSLKRSKRLARATPIMLARPELFIHCMEKSEAVQRLLYELRGWTVDNIPDQYREWTGAGGRRKAEAIFAEIDKKLRELTQRPHEAAMSLRPGLQALKAKYPE